MDALEDKVFAAGVRAAEGTINFFIEKGTGYLFEWIAPDAAISRAIMACRRVWLAKVLRSDVMVARESAS